MPSKHHSITSLVGNQKPVVAYPKEIHFGPITLDGFMLKNGEFRQSINSTAKALGAGDWLTRRTLIRVLDSAEPKNLDSDSDSALSKADSAEAVIVPVVSPGVSTYSSLAYSINLPMVVEIWKQIAKEGNKYSDPAFELLGLSAVHSLERAYQEAFGVADARSTDDRLLEWAIRLDPGKHFPLFGGQFHKDFARVTGVTVGHPYARVCLAELVYHRLPETIYETLKDINPLDERGWRQFSHSQLMTDDMRQQMREIVSAVGNQLANTKSKADDSKAYKKCLHRLDKTLPRYKKRGGIIDNLTKKIEGNSDGSN